MTRSARRFEICFLLLAGCIYTAALLSFDRSGSGSDPLSLGFAVDLALTVPLLAYLLPVPKAGWPLLSLPALALLGLVAVLLFGPAGLPLPFRSPEALLIALEWGLTGSVAVRAHRAPGADLRTQRGTRWNGSGSPPARWCRSNAWLTLWRTSWLSSTIRCSHGAHLPAFRQKRRLLRTTGDPATLASWSPC